MNSNEGKQKYFLIYQITNLLDNRIYVGCHCTYNVNDKYMGSSKYLKKDIKELGRQNFKKEILHVFDNKEDMIKMEAEIVNREFCHRTDTYNKMVGGVSEFSWLGTVTVKDKDENYFRVYKDDPRYISGELIHSWVGKIHPNPRKKGSKHSDEAKEKMREKALNRVVSDETREKMSDQRKGSKNYTYGTCWINKDGINKLIKKEELEVYLQDKWNRGSKLGKRPYKKQSDEHIKNRIQARKNKQNPS